MNKRLRAAVIGVGYLGNFHAQKYLHNSQVELVGVCDQSPSHTDRMASELGVAAIHRAEDLIGRVDMVTVATNTLSHYEVAKMFLENGVHVNVEKPMTATLPQAEELIEIAKSKNLQLAVGHIERFNPAIIELRKHMKDVKVIELTRVANYKARGADVSVLHDLMIHDMDLLYWLSESEIDTMHASGIKLISQELDTGTAAFKMKNGILVYIHVSRVSPVAMRSIRITQADGIITVNTGTLELEKISAGSGMSDPIRVAKWTVPKEDALQKETDAFVAAVASGGACAVTGMDGYKALKAIEDVLAVIENRK